MVIMSPPASTNVSDERSRNLYALERVSGQHGRGNNFQRSATFKDDLTKRASTFVAEAEPRGGPVCQSVADMMSAFEQLRILNRSADGRRGHAQRAQHVYEVGDRAHRSHFDAVIGLVYRPTTPSDDDQFCSGKVLPELVVERDGPTDGADDKCKDQDQSLFLENASEHLESCSSTPRPAAAQLSRQQSTAPLQESMGTDRSIRWALHQSQVIECCRREMARSSSAGENCASESATLSRRMSQRQDPLPAPVTPWSSSPSHPMNPLYFHLQPQQSRPQSRTQSRVQSQENLDCSQHKRKQQHHLLSHQKSAELHRLQSRGGSRGSQRSRQSQSELLDSPAPPVRRSSCSSMSGSYQMLEEENRQLFKENIDKLREMFKVEKQKQRQPPPLSNSSNTRTEKSSSPLALLCASGGGAQERPPLPSGSRQKLPLSAPRITPGEGPVQCPRRANEHGDSLTLSTAQIQGLGLSSLPNRDHTKAITPAGMMPLGALLQQWPGFICQDESDEGLALPQPVFSKPKIGSLLSALHVVGRPCNNREKRELGIGGPSFAWAAKQRPVLMS